MLDTMTPKSDLMESLLRDPAFRQVAKSARIEKNYVETAIREETHKADTLEAVYEMTPKFCEALAEALETGNMKMLRLQVEWDVANFVNDNGGIDEWLS